MDGGANAAGEWRTLKSHLQARSQLGDAVAENLIVLCADCSSCSGGRFFGNLFNIFPHSSQDARTDSAMTSNVCITVYCASRVMKASGSTRIA